MGKTLLDFLAIEKPHAQVYCINRGKIYWYNLSYSQEQRGQKTPRIPTLHSRQKIAQRFPPYGQVPQ